MKRIKKVKDINKPVLPPGTILQYMYLKDRITKLRPGKFLEIGCGVGNLSRIFLEKGWSGIGLDLNLQAINENKLYNHSFIEKGCYKIYNMDFFDEDSLSQEEFDVVISSMVIEHLDENMENKYFEKCKSFLNENGLIIIFVPASQSHWGIEDEIAGHYRRYTVSRIRELAKKSNLKVQDLSGLTFPVSNLLLPLSNFLVRRSESNKNKLDFQLRTIDSGFRKVQGKTVFPNLFRLLLNEILLFPLHLLQKLFKKSSRCMVLYSELRK